MQILFKQTVACATGQTLSPEQKQWQPKQSFEVFTFTAFYTT